MKILTNTNLHSGGGIAKRANEMIRFFQNKNLPLVVIGMERGDYEEEEKGSVKIYHVPLPRGIKSTTAIYQNLGSLDELKKRLREPIDQVRRIIEKEGAEVTISEGTFYAPWILHHASKRECLPTIVAYAGILTKEESEAPEPLSNLFREMELDFNRKDNFYIFPSHLTKKEIEKIFGRSIKKSAVIANGISEEFFEPSDVEKKSRRIGFVGRNHPIKNIEFLIKLAEEIARRGGDYQISAVSEIRKDEKMKRNLKRGGIEITSTLNTAELRDFYRESGIVISPSHFETYGNVPIESIASGTPAIANSNMGAAETLKHLGLDYLIMDDFDSPEDVMDKIEETAGSTIDEKTKRRMKREFSWKSIMEKYYEIFITALAA